jgi:hypothetical protein
MRRPTLVAASLLLSLLIVIPVLAAPRVQEVRPVIAQPEQDAPVRGVVQIIGTAVHPEFQRYELYYAPWPVPSDQSWVFIGDAHFSQQPLGLLGTWDSRSVPDGTYALRVRVVKQDGNYSDSDPRRVLAVNTRQPETPTPSVTEAPTEAPVELPPTPTVVIEVPTVIVDLPTIQPTETPESNETAAIAAPGGTGDAGATSVVEVLGVSRLVATVKKTALYTAGGLAVIGAFFAVKGVLGWLWHLVRP